ncbi:MAG: hypothetical protein QOF72_1206, partial [Blastocatellia bacterium]|nr:hypothetical protein [Blastocatellia bacterium]
MQGERNNRLRPRGLESARRLSLFDNYHLV